MKKENEAHAIHATWLMVFCGCLVLLGVLWTVGFYKIDLHMEQVHGRLRAIKEDLRHLQDIVDDVRKNCQHSFLMRDRSGRPVTLDAADDHSPPIFTVQNAEQKTAL